MAIVFLDTNIVIEYLKNNAEVIEALGRYEKSISMTWSLWSFIRVLETKES